MTAFNIQITLIKHIMIFLFLFITAILIHFIKRLLMEDLSIEAIFKIYGAKNEKLNSFIDQNQEVYN